MEEGQAGQENAPGQCEVLGTPGWLEPRQPEKEGVEAAGGRGRRLWGEEGSGQGAGKAGGQQVPHEGVGGRGEGPRHLPWKRRPQDMESWLGDTELMVSDERKQVRQAGVGGECEGQPPSPDFSDWTFRRRAFMTPTSSGRFPRGRRGGQGLLWRGCPRSAGRGDGAVASRRGHRGSHRDGPAGAGCVGP